MTDKVIYKICKNCKSKQYDSIKYSMCYACFTSNKCLRCHKPIVKTFIYCYDCHTLINNTTQFNKCELNI